MTVVIIVALVLYGVIESLRKRANEHSIHQSPSSLISKPSIDRDKAREELRQIDTPEYLYHYIVNVINHGSHTLGFPGGEMEGGYVPPESAPEIACYVMKLGGHRCPHSYSRDAQMYFSSVCAGCHGLDGKGLHGTYPDLTRPTLLGIERRKIFLKGIVHPH
ncbi:hypothetical protein Nitsa_1739 [Nitratifractor salsuginis DSM 16511]|uniref:Cytochrome c domain-containing protein n=1 Tax=Nitratifractor salsuginis (strain DSM 16511 / JCM 12458 / E9I37-1) TaxID=749222 RepID=E6X1C3_NITSE|nr:hypothetical protein Nitsa_1739 [Nitratifractor salsuginis DSM 16511]